MQFVNLCGYPASFSLFDEPWGPFPAGKHYAVVGRFSLVGIRPTSEIRPDGTLMPTLSATLDFPAPAEGVVYLVTPDVAIALGRPDVIGVRRSPPPAPVAPTIL
jgi:hypothetical protein